MLIIISRRVPFLEKPFYCFERSFLWSRKPFNFKSISLEITFSFPHLILPGQKSLDAFRAVALGPEDRCSNPRNSQPFHMAKLLVKCEFWKFRVPEHELTKEIVFLAKILAGPIFTGKSKALVWTVQDSRWLEIISLVKTHKAGHSWDSNWRGGLYFSPW